MKEKINNLNVGNCSDNDSNKNKKKQRKENK
jgi:hypothetical protein